jgi:hypothetical protein
MAKSGQHHNDAVNPSQPRGHEKSRGNNHPDRSQTITTGTYKKKETYREQAARHEDPYRSPSQEKINDWNDDIREAPVTTHSPRARESDIGGRSGSDSNAS